eukprot:530834_1
MMSSMAPIVTPDKMVTAATDVRAISEACFAQSNLFTKLSDFDVNEDKYMAVSINYRGYVKAKEASASARCLKENKKMSLFEWCPTLFKIGLNKTPPPVVENEDKAPSARTCLMNGNKTAI